MPNSHEQLASNGDNGLIGVFTSLFEGFELRFAVGVGTDSTPSGFDHGPAEFFTATFGDAFTLMFLTTVVNTGTDASIADQVLGMLEAGNIANGREHSHGEDDAQARDLHEKDHIFSPRIAITKAGQFLMDGFFVSSQMSQDEQVLLDLKAHHRREILLLPPGEVLFGEKLAFGWDEIEAVDETVQTVLGHGDLLVDTPAMRDQRAQLSDVKRRHPDFGDHIGDEKSEQAFDIELVGLDLGTRDFANFQGIGDDGLSNQRVDKIVDFPGIGSRFDDDSISGCEVLLNPLREARHAHFASAEYPLLLVVHSADHDIVFVNVDGDETLDGY